MASKNLKKIIIFVFLAALLAPNLSLAATKKTVAKVTVAKKAALKKPAEKVYQLNDLINHFVIETQSYDRLWYIGADKQRYFIQSNDDLRLVINKFAVKILAGRLNSIPANASSSDWSGWGRKYQGKIVFAGSSSPWYVNPANKVRYSLADYDEFYKLIKASGLKIKDPALRLSRMNSQQLTYDPAYPAVAYAKYDGANFTDQANASAILPVASLSKLMTALVLLDQNLDFSRQATITAEEIGYPRLTVGDGETSEVDLRAGDIVRMSDLWIAMLTASSNQSAVILADNSGLTREQFAAAMNKKARELGLQHTVFKEMTGLTPNNISTAREFALLANAAFARQEIVAATKYTDYTFTAQQADGSPRDVKVANRNYSLLAMGADASKTGYLVEAQRTVALKKNGNIIVVLHAFSMGQRNTILKKLLTETKVTLAE